MDPLGLGVKNVKKIRGPSTTVLVPYGPLRVKNVKQARGQRGAARHFFRDLKMAWHDKFNIM